MDFSPKDRFDTLTARGPRDRARPPGLRAVMML